MKLEAVRKRVKALGGRLRQPETLSEPVVHLREKRRKRKNSRGKGNRHELRVAAKFTAWCGNIVRRSPRSGGWDRSGDFGAGGDLVCRKKRFPFHVECKWRENWLLTDLITGKRGTDTRSIMEWWNQTTRTCPEKKIPLLVFTKNYQPDFAMLRIADMDRVEPTGWWAFCRHFRLETDELSVVILLLDDMLKVVSVPRGLRNHQRKVPGE